MTRSLASATSSRPLTCKVVASMGCTVVDHGRLVVVDQIALCVLGDDELLRDNGRHQVLLLDIVQRVLAGVPEVSAAGDEGEGQQAGEDGHESLGAATGRELRGRQPS